MMPGAALLLKVLEAEGGGDFWLSRRSGIADLR